MSSGWNPLTPRVEKLVPLTPRREKLVHLGEVSVDDVLTHVSPDAPLRTYGVEGASYTLKITSVRLRVFQRSRVCAICGLVGTKMMLDLPVDTNVPHFNLYAEEAGELVLMTKDHVKPKSLGGGEDIDNLRTACHTCNNARGNNVNLTDDDIRRIRVTPAGWPQNHRDSPERAAERLAIKLGASTSSSVPLPLVTETVDEENPTAMAWALVRYAYAIAGAIGLGDEARAFDAAKKAQQLLGKLLGKLKPKAEPS